MRVPKSPAQDLAWHLKEYLDPEDLKLLSAEYVLEEQALIKKLRAEAARLEKPKRDFDSPFWEPLSWSNNNSK